MAEPTIKPYYQHGGVTIYHGDCRELLPQLEGVDVVITDPPYSVGRSECEFSASGIEERYCEIAAKRLSQEWLEFREPQGAPAAEQGRFINCG